MFSDTVLTVPDVATFLRISKPSVYKLIHEGGLPAFKVGKHYRFMQEEVQDWVRQGAGNRE